LSDNLPSATVPVPVSKVCLAEFAQKHNVKLSPWAYEGISNLNGSISQIKESVNRIKKYIDNDEPLFFSKGLLEFNEELYSKLTQEDKKRFGDCSTAFCLMIRKEFGQNQFHKILKSEKGIKGFEEILHFKGYTDLDKSFKQYLFDIIKEVGTNNVPDEYLQIQNRKQD
jgi:hypothetical protein